MEPLRAANELAGRNLYEIWNIPAQGARATASCGAIIPANAHVGERVGYDLVLVVASNDSEEAKQPRLLDWLRQLARQKIVVGGLAAGPLMLARAGLLRGREMTLHWALNEAFEERYPDVTVAAQLFVVDADRVTCAGGTAPVDLMLAVIDTQHGKAFAQQVSDWWSHVHAREAKTPQRSGHAIRYQTHNMRVISAITLMENHVTDPLDLPQLAAAVGVSERQLNRLFNQFMSEKTMAFYRKLRLKRSYQLLSQTAVPIRDIMIATGFVSPSHFSRLFKQEFNQTPNEARMQPSNSLKQI